MNYAGKFDAAISLDGLGSRSPADGHVDSFTAKAHGHVPDGAFVVPDPNLIFNGDFKRAGLDLVLSHDGHDFVVHDYFRGDKRAAIASPDGAHLTGDVVNALTGHVQYAQAASGIAAAQVIGHVTKLSGSATAVRNGVSVILNNGDNVEKGDVVSTGGDSTLGITFIDGTVFGLSSNARMVLNDMVYDPNGSNNSSLLSLVAGTITFVAGETAKHGDMKVDTPVATMGIRGTAVLSQINFVVPAGGGDPQPQASFQVLVEPNGTTGSYILFDKVTLLPIATVNQAGQMIQISGGNVSISNALMSPDIQKLITDVFTLKFTDNNSNTKLTQNFTDSITQTGNIVFIKTDTGATATATFTHLPEPGSQGTGHNPSTSTRIPGPPVRQSLDLNGNVKTAFEMIERAGTTGDTTHYDTISGRITFVDQNLADLPTVSIDLGDAPNFVYKNAGQQDVTGALSALQKQDIAATQIQLSVAAAAGNNNNGSAVWTYTIPDHVFDFLAAGETLTLTYKVRVNNNFSVNPETSTIDITITITGTNDKPVITTSVPTIIFEGGTSVPGGPLTSDVPTSGTLSFDDVDLTDKHTVSVALSSATLPDGTVPPGPLAAFQSAMSVAIAAGADSTGDGTGTINWSLADLPVYLADFIPKGEVLTLVYTVTLKDAQGATSQQTITVTITGTDAPAVVWIATDKPGAPSGGFWKDAANWATGTVPTINDDVIVITDQLHGLTPSYPVTIDTAAFAKSITMNDYDTAVGHKAPEVINKSALTIAGEISLKADSKLTNFTASTISVGGKAEFLDSSVLTNAGYLTLKGGGDFANGTTITNSGTIELFGGTLKTLAGINNAGGTLKADAGTTLIVDTATISGGTVTIAGTLELDGSSVLKNGTLNNSGAVNVKGTADFAHETVANTSGGTIKVLANGWLTIDQGSGVANTGNVTVDATGKLTVNGATISGTGTVTGNGEIDLTGAAVLSGGILNNNAVFKVSGTGNVLDHETVTNASTGTIEVLANGALTIDQGSTVANAGNVTVDANGKLTVNGATLNGAGTVTGNGEIDLTGAAVLSGGILNNNAAFKVSGSGNALDHETITNATTGTIEVLANGALTIDQGSTVANAGNVTVDANGKLTVNGATINGAGTVTSNGEIDLTGGAVLSGGILNNNAAFKVSGTGNALDHETITNASTGTIEVLANGTLTIDQGSTVANAGNVTIDSAGKLTVNGATISGTGTVTGNGEIDLTGAAVLSGGILNNNAAFKVSGTGNALDHGTITNAGTGTIEVLANGALTIDQGSTVANAGNVTVDANGKLTVNGATINGTGTVTGNGEIDLTGAAVLSGGILNNNAAFKVSGTGNALDHETVTNASTGTIEVLANGALTIDQGSTVANAGNVTVDANGKLTVNGATINGTGTVTGNGEIDLTGAAVLSGGILNNNAALKVSGTGNALDHETITNASTGTIEVLTNGALTIDQGSTVANAGNVTVDANGKLTVNGATISGGTINGLGTIDVTGASKIDQSATLSTTAVTVESGVILTLDDVIVAGTAIANHGTVKVDAGSKLTLNGASLTGGALTVSGTLNSTGTTAITDANISNNYLIEATLGALTLLATTSASSIANGGILRANGAELDINGEAIANTGTLAAINHGTLKLIGMTVTDTGSGSVSVESGSALDLQGATIDGGTVTIAGTLESTGTSAIDNADITNTGTITVTSGTLTIDPATLHAITNHNLIQAKGGVLDVSGEDISNTAALEAVNHGTLKLANLTVSNSSAGSITVDGTSKLYLTDVSINGGSLSNAGNLYSAGVDTVTGSVTNTGIIEVQSGILDLAGGIAGSGKVIVDVGATLEFSGATGSIHIVNSGSIVGAGGNAAIHIQQDTTGSVINNSGTIGPPAASSVTSATDAIIEIGGSLTINNTGHINGNISVASATFNNESGGTWTVAGTSAFGNASSIVNDGVIDLLNGASISLGGPGLVNHSHIDSWGTASISGTISNTGSIEVHDGELSLFGLLTGTGSVTVDAGALLKLEGTVAQTINLAGDGAAVEIDTDTFGGSIAELSANDTIDLSTIKYGLGTSAVYVANSNPATGGVLTVTDADGNHISLNLAGADYSNAHFAGSDDGTGHTLITMTDDHAPAFTAGGVLAGGVSEQADATGDFATSDTSTPATGAIDFTDIDLTDLPSAQITGQDVTSLGADHSTNLTSSLSLDEIAALKSGLTLLPQAGLNNGIVTWSYSIADGALDFLAKDQTAKVVSTITSTDDYGETATTDVTVTITGKNDAPTLAAVTTDPLVDTSIADSFSDVTGMLVGTDADHGETAGLTYAVLNADSHGTTAGLYGSLTVNANGTYTYVPDAASINALSEGPCSDVFTIQTTDAQGAVGTASFTVAVTGANDAPVLTDGSIGQLTDTCAADNFSDLTGQVVGTDADSGDTLTYTLLNADHQAVGEVTGHYGALALNTNGTYTYVPDAASINALPGCLHYSDSFTVQVTDAHGAASTAIYTVDLTGANDVPTLSALNLGKLTDTAATDTFSNLTGNLAGTDADADETVTLTYSVQNADSCGTAPGHYGALTVHSDGSYTYVPDAAAINALQEGPFADTFTVQTTDAHGATGTATLTVDVDGANDAPVMDVNQISLTHDDAQVTVHGISATDSDAAANETFTLVASGSGSNLSPASTSDTLAHINSALQTVTYTDASEGAAIQTVTLTVADSHNASKTVSLLFGTAGQDDFIGTGHQDQFVFAASSNNDTITNFTPGQDHIDLSAVVTASDFGAWMAQHVAASPTNSADTLVTINASDTILLKGVAHLQASDFIVHA
ncbi:VCBS domain-containing protein [Bradyrhizobium sp. 171]|nr:VCBS domain-containing protein [Bradyrhizobium sp. 18]MCK1535565.1 VCBS domain-containing protein [Bradyrhizobium sp. 176]MCK1555129.1 VCBS domain-containing protein [Bradyrhizobium sp. 171]MCK1767488.1 VCBS domain-containing protein [Bradyrhizobium sp. 136]